MTKRYQKTSYVYDLVRDILLFFDNKRVAELEAIEERYRALLEDGNVAVFVTDLESNTYVEVNREAVDLLGYSEQELLQMGPADIVGEGAPPSELREELRRTGNSSVRYNAKRADGTEIELHTTTRYCIAMTSRSRLPSRNIWPTTPTANC